LKKEVDIPIFFGWSFCLCYSGDWLSSTKTENESSWIRYG